MRDLVIKGGTIVTSASMYQADIKIRDGKIAMIGTGLDMQNCSIVDAAGLLVLPGAIDMHTHMSDPFGGTVSSDDEKTGSMAAACGGVTTMFDFATQEHGGHLLDAIEKKKGQYEKKACIDYALHCIVTDLLPDDAVLDEFESVVACGVNTFKCYLDYRKEGLMVEDEMLAKIMVTAAREGGITAIHAENAGLVDYLTEKFLAEGRTAPWYHYMSRPEYVAAEAEQRVILMAENLDAPLYIVHMNNRDGLLAMQKAKSEGYPIYAETCPHYLEFNNEVYHRDDAVKFVCSPSIKQEESRLALWKALENGTIDTVATDHCPFLLEEKNWGKDDFTKIPNGCGGIENRFPYMLSAANIGKISYCKAVEVCCENPARIFGCRDKGKIEIGKDADIVLYDPELIVTSGSQNTHTACDHSIWDGYVYHGYPVQTYLRGKLIFEHGNYAGTPGDGKYLKREKFNRRK